MIIRSYSELSELETFEERYKYLRLKGFIGEETFGFDRFVNQIFYRSQEWKRVRDIVIVRDNGCDLGIRGREIHDRVIIHHMNPISLKEIENRSDFVLNPDFLITTTHNTHNAIHYGSEDNLILIPIERRPNDTCPWKKG